MERKKNVLYNKFNLKELPAKELFHDRMSMKKVLLIFIVLSLYSCREQNNNNNFELIKSSRLDVSDSIRLSSDFIFLGDLLILSDFGDFDYLKAIDVKSDKIVKKFGKLGEGPCEIKPHSNIQRVNDFTVGVFDRQGFRYLEYSIENIDSVYCQNETKKFDFNIQKLVKLNDDFFFGVGLYDGRYILTNSTNYSIDSIFLDYPFNDELPISFEEKAMLFQGNFTTNSKLQRIAFATRSSPALDILSFESNKIDVVKRISGTTLPIFASDNTGQLIGATLDNSNVWGYLSITSSNSYLYLLYSGKRTDEEYQNSDIVLVYDWDGNLVKKLNLDQKVSEIVVDEDDNYLVGYLDDGRANLFLYKF